MVVWAADQALRPARAPNRVASRGRRVKASAWAVNIHHLELFFHVAKHGGISRAVRNMPYGIQQPAVSSQILLLEQDLGVKLFDRSPFRLTPQGEELFAFARPFFENLSPIAAKLRRGAAPHLRVAASEWVLRDYLPAVIKTLRQREPGLRLALRSGLQATMEQGLIEGDVDLAFTPLETRPSGRIRSLGLLQLPLVLVVPAKSRLRRASDLWARGEIGEPLICLPSTEVITRRFRDGLKRLKIEWAPAIEASSMELITQYVANGYGVGVSVEVGPESGVRGVRRIPLDGFAPLVIAALWTGKPIPLVQALLDESQRYVAARWPQQALAGWPKQG
jgi:DNA-binding transcriptional LysR family regulator